MVASSTFRRNLLPGPVTARPSTLRWHDTDKIQLGGNEALSVTFWIQAAGAPARLDEQPPVVPTGRAILVRLVYVDASGPHDALWLGRYVSDRERFNDGLPDFVRFISRISWPGPLFGRDSPLP